MSGFLIRGDVDTIEIADHETFDDTTGGFYLKMEKLADEGNSYPSPEGQTAGLLGGFEGPTAVDVPFTIRALKVAIADAEKLEDKAYDLVDFYARYTMQDGTKITYHPVRLSEVLPMPVTGRSEYGPLQISGKAAGIKASDVQNVVQASAGSTSTSTTQ